MRPAGNKMLQNSALHIWSEFAAINNPLGMYKRQQQHRNDSAAPAAAADFDKLDSFGTTQAEILFLCPYDIFLSTGIIK